MNLHVFSLKTLTIYALLTLTTILTGQVISTPTVIPVDEPLVLNYTVSGDTIKRVNISLSISSNYANLSLIANNKVLLDNIDVAGTWVSNLNSLVTFQSSGDVELTIVAQEQDITINSLDFVDVGDCNFPVFTEITGQSGIYDDPSLKYGGPSIADMDNDGHYDLILNNHNDVPSKLFWSNGDATFTKHDKDLSLWKLMDLHGSAAGDYDNDGDLDLVIALGGGNGTSPQPPVFYKNDNGNFVRSATDVGITSGARGRSPRWSDCDLDGDLDLILINAHGINGNNGAQHIFYTNKGDGTFSVVNVAGIENASAERVLVTDLNNDYIDDIVLFSPLSVWKGNGDFTYTDVTTQWLPASAQGKWGILAATDIDIDNDGDFDLYLAGGQGYYDVANRNSVDFDPILKKLDMRLSGDEGTTPFDLVAGDSLLLYDFSYVGRSTYDGDFPIFLGSSKSPVIIESSEDSLVITEDIADGWPASRTENGLYIGYTGAGNWKVESVRNADIFWSIHLSIDKANEFSSSWAPNNRNSQDMLLRNDNGSFVDVSTEWNIPIGGNHWGVTTGDFNNDSYQDLYIYRFGYLKSRISDYMLLNTGEGKFEVTTSHSANDAGSRSHGDMGQAYDFDLDGDVDILNGDDEYGTWHLYRNDKADNYNYAIVKVGYSPISNIDPISADIMLSTANDTLHKRVGSSGEVFSQSLLNMVHFGLGEADSIKNITIRWRNGETAEFNNKKVNQIFDTDKVDPINITLVPSTENVRAGTDIELDIELEPSYANRSVYWRSINETIASVDSATGIITGHIEGQATQIVVTSLANGITDTATVNVVAWYPIPADSISVTPDAVELIEGNIISLTAEVFPKYADNKTVVWTSNDTSIAIVDSNGLVTTKSAGEVIITGALESDNSITDQTVLTVISLIAPSIVFDSIAKYGETAYVKGGTMEVSVNYHAGTGNTVISSNHGGIKFWLRHLNVDWGVIEDIIVVDTNALGEISGTSSVSIPLTDVTPTSELTDDEFYFLFASFVSSNGESYNAGVWPIDIIEKPELELSISKVNITIGETFELNATVKPENVKDNSVIWNVDNEQIASVNEEGAVTGLAVGKTIVSATTVEGNVRSTCEISVTEETTTLAQDNQTKLSVFPNPATDKLFISGADGSDCKIKIIDITGKECIYQENIGSEALNISSLQKGMYTVVVKGKAGTKTFKLMKL